jgi:hypothetical protein
MEGWKSESSKQTLFLVAKLPAELLSIRLPGRSEIKRIGQIFFGSASQRNGNSSGHTSTMAEAIEHMILCVMRK